MSNGLMWSHLIIGAMTTLGVIWILAFTLPNQRTRSVLSYLFPLLVVIACAVLGTQYNAFARLALSSLVLLYTFKGSSLLKIPLQEIRKRSPLGLAFYSICWPGIDPTPFGPKPMPTIENSARFSAGVVRALIGVAGFLLISGYLSNLSTGIATWLGVLALLTIFHLGISDAATDATRAIGWKVQPLFDAPWRSTSLSNFWSQRWNRPFVELNKIFFLPWLARRFGMKGAIFGIFLISGFLHELAISYPAFSGWGSPMLYFAIQGALVLAERKLPFKGPIWVAIVVLSPVWLLFHNAFRSALILPLLTWTHDTMHGIGVMTAISWLITFLGIAQFCVLAASFQVPTRLRWREELPRLSSLNHKLMWTYGSFIVFTIVSWGILTLFLHQEILAGTRAGLAVSTVIFLFWGLRLLTDSVYFNSRDWPEGPFMQIGHTLLNCLFTFVFAGYGLILSWHIYRFFLASR